MCGRDSNMRLREIMSLVHTHCTTNSRNNNMTKSFTTDTDKINYCSPLSALLHAHGGTSPISKKMPKIFTTDRGDKFVFCEALQSLTGSIFIALRYRLRHHTWDVFHDIDLDAICGEDIERIQSLTLAEAVADADWASETAEFDRELQDTYLDEYHALPYAILELHPERGARLHRIMPDDVGYRAGHEPACGLDVAADLGFMWGING